MLEKNQERNRNKSHPRKPPVPPAKKKDPLLNEIFFDKYKTIKKLGEGSFGKVYKAEYNGEFYALKFESRSRTKSLLEMESTIMAYLQGPNIPFIKSFGYSGDYNLLVMQYMDKSLEDIFHIRKTFSIKTTAMIGFQLIGVLHFIHDKNFIHRDVKPDNIVMGSAELNENLYLIDFGLAKKYRSSRTLKQYPMTRKKKLTGTARYASINALEGMEQSRRDDIESVGYVLAYLLRGGLPWQGLKIKTKENKYKNILEKKKEISSEELFKGFPIEFAEILDNAKKLEYLEEPEYEMLRNKLLSLCKRLNYKFDYIYDWTTEKDLLKRKEKKCYTSIKTQSTLSVKNKNKRPKSKRKVKYFEKSVDELRHKSRKRKNEKNEEKDMDNNNSEIKENENIDKKDKEIKDDNDDKEKEYENKENKNDNEIKVEINDDVEKKEEEENNKNNYDNEENKEKEEEDNNKNKENKDKEQSVEKNNNENDNENNKDKEKDINSEENNNIKENKKDEIHIMGEEFDTIEKNQSNKNEDNENKSNNSNNANKSEDSHKDEQNINCIETKGEQQKNSNKSEENEDVEQKKEDSKKSKSNCAEIGEEEIIEDTEKTVCCIL